MRRRIVNRGATRRQDWTLGMKQNSLGCERAGVRWD
jgi:hypothetical protein